MRSRMNLNTWTKKELIEKIDEQQFTIKNLKQKLIDIRKILDKCMVQNEG